MERRARRWRLPLAARIGAVPALVALAGGLTFGFFSQSDAAPAGHQSWATTVKLSSPRPPATEMPVFSSRNADLSATVSVKSSQDCVPGHCDDLHGTVRAWIQMDGKPAGTKFSAEVTGSGGLNGASVTIKIPGSELSAPGYGFILFDFSSAEFGYSSDGERLKVRDKYSGLFDLSQSADNSLPGEKVDFTATYAGGDAVPDAPTGTLQLNASVGGDVRPVPNGKISVTGKTFTFSTTKLPKGTRFVSWTYSGDDKFDADNQYHSLTHTVKDGVETTTEVSPAGQWVVGSSTDVKVAVKAKSGSAVPTGRVKISIDNASPSEHELVNGSIGDFAVLFAVAGEHTIAAEYEPTGDFAQSASPEVKVIVAKADTTTSVTAAPESAEKGKPITLSAKVVGPRQLEGTPGGEVTFTDGNLQLGSCTVEIGKQCEISTDKLPLGKRTVKASYAGNHDLNGSSGTAGVRVSEASTTKLTATPGSVTVGSPVSLSAQVSGGTPASGKVTFLDGTTEIGKSDVDKGGKAALSTSALAVGTHQLTAKFEGTDTAEPSTSEKVTVQVNAAGTPGQGGGSQNGGSSGGTGGSGGSTPQPKNLASTGADLGAPLWGGAALVILGAVAVTLGRKRRRSSR